MTAKPTKQAKRKTAAKVAAGKSKGAKGVAKAPPKNPKLPPGVKKTAAKKTAVKKTAKKKAVTKKTAAKKTAVKKTAAKKTAKRKLTPKQAKEKAARAKKLAASKKRTQSASLATLQKNLKKAGVKNPAEKATAMCQQYFRKHSTGKPGTKAFKWKKDRKVLVAELMKMGFADATAQTQASRFSKGIHPKGFTA